METLVLKTGATAGLTNLHFNVDGSIVLSYGDPGKPDVTLTAQQELGDCWSFNTCLPTACMVNIIADMVGELTELRKSMADLKTRFGVLE